MMGANYGRRKEDEIEIDILPKWLRIIMESGLWNCIWIMSLLQIINYADEK